MQDWINLISTCGFPIACCAFMLYQNAKQDEYNRKQQDELKKAIDNNTRSITELTFLVRELMDDDKRN